MKFKNKVKVENIFNHFCSFTCAVLLKHWVFSTKVRKVTRVEVKVNTQVSCEDFSRSSSIDHWRDKLVFDVTANRWIFDDFPTFWSHTNTIFVRHQIVVLLFSYMQKKDTIKPKFTITGFTKNAGKFHFELQE